MHVTLNEAVLFEARTRPVSGDNVTRAFAAGADFYPALQWPPTQRKPVHGWQQPLADMRLNEQLGSPDISRISRGGGDPNPIIGLGYGASPYGLSPYGS